MVILALVVLAAFVLSLALLTALGAHKRGVATPLAALAGVLFPLTWIVWYVRDEHPYRVRHHVA